MSNHLERPGHKKTSCACQFTNPATPCQIPNHADNNTDTRHSESNPGSRTHDSSYPLLSSISFPASSPSSPSRPWLVLPTVPVYLALVQVGTWTETPVRVRNHQRNRTRWAALGCDLDKAELWWILAGLELDCGSILRLLQHWLWSCFRVLIVSQHGLYIKDSILGALSPTGLQFALRSIFVESLWSNTQNHSQIAGFQQLHNKYCSDSESEISRWKSS